MHNFKINIKKNLRLYSNFLNLREFNQINQKFKKNGILRFKNLSLNSYDLIKFTDLFTETYSNDAARRTARMGSKNIRNVDLGSHEVTLHSEASFSPVCPEIIWFYCLRPPKKNSGRTIFCDGIVLWDKLSTNIKKKFLQEPICYSLKIPVDLNLKGKGKKKWFLNNPGVKNCYLDLDKKTINFDYINFAVRNSKVPGKLAFANHLLSLKDETQLISIKMYSGKKISQKIINEINFYSKKTTQAIDWKKGDLIMIDNFRFMHGREAIHEKDQQRDIVNIQTFRSRYDYGHFIK